MNRIDTHLHLVYPERFGYDWTKGLPALAEQAFRLEDYWQAAEGCQIGTTIFMEVDVNEAHRFQEAQMMCELSEDPKNRIAGVIAAGRPESELFGEELDRMSHPNLLGIRRVLHNQDDSLSQGKEFRENLRLLGREGMTFDVCAQARQLPVMVELVDACPNTQFVLDHCGNPSVAGGLDDGWVKQVKELAKRGNVVCKVSGIIASADPARVTVEAIRPFFETVVEQFGWDRLMFGGDWPVCLLTSDLRKWVEILDELLMSENEMNRSAFYMNNAKRVYQLGSRA